MSSHWKWSITVANDEHQVDCMGESFADDEATEQSIQPSIAKGLIDQYPEVCGGRITRFKGTRTD